MGITDVPDRKIVSRSCEASRESSFAGMLPEENQRSQNNSATFDDFDH